MDKPEKLYGQVWLTARSKEDEKVQQIVYVIYKAEEFIYLLDVTNSVYEKVLLLGLFVMSYKTLCNVSLLNNFSYYLS